MKKAIVVGAGIVGLASARALAQKGYKVVVVERDHQARSASIRNFGMVWPIGQPSGPLLEIALRSREIWLEVGKATDIFMDEVGSLHLAYHQDEVQVLKEFYQLNEEEKLGYQLDWVSPENLQEYSKSAIAKGFLGGIYSHTEVIVDPRQVIAELPNYLSTEYGVEFMFDTTALTVNDKGVETSAGFIAADEVVICSGADFENLYPEVYQDAEITKCKLQMMRTKPQLDNWRLGPAIAGGLTLTHYKAFADCPTLPELKKRIDEEFPDFEKWGVHVMTSQNGVGELVIGDTHEYGNSPSPFDKQFLNHMILDYLKGMCTAPNFEISETWHGVYAKMTNDSTYFVKKVADNCTILNGLGGAGMTMSFGVAEDVVEKYF